MEKGSENSSRTSKQIAFVAIYAATTVGCAYILTIIPNVEFFTVLVFLGGLIFGKFIGLMNGFLSSLIYFIFNIYGQSPMPLLVVQLSVYTTLGLLGGVVRGTKIRVNITGSTQIIYGLIGLFFILGYTMLSDFVFSLVMGVNFLVWYLQGIIFTLTLTICNFLTFSLLIPTTLSAVDSHSSLFPTPIN
ncbi:MAG: hypothetical protein ACTSUE_19125 [Promethearchaeota archaeon]